MDKHVNDIAADTFLAKWPTWLRWALFLPSALLGSVLIAGTIFVINTSFNGFKEGSFWYSFFDIARTGLIGMLFVLIGGFVAPKHQLDVAIILAVTGGVIGGFFLFALLFSSAFTIADLLGIVAFFIGITAAVIGIRIETSQ